MPKGAAKFRDSALGNTAHKVNKSIVSASM